MSGLEGLLAGRTLADRYRVEEVIGRGGMAAVYRASDEVLGRSVAVKVITVVAPNADGRERARARFHREARALARLQHPNVVTVFDFGTDTELQLDYLVMELLQGEDLASRLEREGKLEQSVALRILREAAAGVEAGHRAGLIHRDVKPGNLFLAESGPTAGWRVCVLDFGIARIITGDEPLTSLTRGHTPLSPAYASPEQLIGDASLSPASDVYSLGVVAHELLTGTRLFEQDTPAGRREEVAPSIRSRHPDVPPALAEVVERALQPEPEHRFVDAGALGEALDLAIAAPGERGVVPPIPPHYHARQHTRLPEQPVHSVRATGTARRGGSRAVLAVVALAALLLVGFWAMRGRSGTGEASGGALAKRASDDPPGASAPASDADSEADALVRELDAILAAGPEGLPAGAPESGDPPAGRATSPAASPAAASAAPRRSGGDTDAVAVNGEGLRLFASGEYGAAVERFRRAVALEPGNPHYLNNLGWALFRAGDLDGAETALDRVVRMDPRRDIVHANLGEVHLARRDTARAIEAYERFLELNSDPRREQIARRKLTLIGGGG